jgi:hypothetical protein
LKNTKILKSYEERDKNAEILFDLDEYTFLINVFKNETLIEERKKLRAILE